MIHMGSDHRCVMATFLIKTPEENTHARRENQKHETIGYVEHTKIAKNTNIEVSELEENIKKSLTQEKNRRQKRKMKYMTQETTRKIKSKERTPQQQQKQKGHLLKL